MIKSFLKEFCYGLGYSLFIGGDGFVYTLLKYNKSDFKYIKTTNTDSAIFMCLGFSYCNNKAVVVIDINNLNIFINNLKNIDILNKCSLFILTNGPLSNAFYDICVLDFNDTESLNLFVNKGNERKGMSIINIGADYDV